MKKFIPYKHFLVVFFLLLEGYIANAGIESLLITEICPVNEQVVVDEYGEYADWIEIYNSGSTDVNLSGIYITDDPSNILKHKIATTDLVVPSGQYFLLWADDTSNKGNKHLPFSISENEKIILYSPAYGIIDSISVKNAIKNVSLGKTSLSKNADIVLYTTPTPGDTNKTEYFKGITGTPVFNINGGFYNSNKSVSLQYTGSDYSIYYTTNSHDPVPSEPGTYVYTGPIDVKSTTVIRARCYQTGYLPGNIVSNTYFINTSYSLPVLSMVTDPDNLFGITGIYDNYYAEGREWERFAQHQYFENGKLVFDVNSGIRIQGGTSVFMDKKSFRLHFRKEYGNEQFEYPLFHNSDLKSTKNIVLKAGYDDDLQMETGTLVRDALSTELWRKMGHLSSGSEWAVLTINGQFWGIYNIRQSIDEDFLINHLDNENFDMIRFQPYQADLKHGTWEEWDHLFSFVSNQGFFSNTSYESINKIMDLDMFIDLMAFVHCSNYRTWVWGASCYKEKNATSKWKWLIWDTDRAYTDYYWDGFYAYNDHPQYDRGWPNIIPYKLTENRLIRNELINKTADLLNSMFVPANAIDVLDSIKNIIAPEIENEQSRWNSYIDWDYNVYTVEEFLELRPDIVRQQISDYFGLFKTYQLTLKINGKGKIKLNSLVINSPTWMGTYYESVPLKMEAMPAAGYLFDGWSNGNTNTRINNFNASSNSTLTANFIPDTTTVYNVMVNEIMYNPSDSLVSGEWFEIYNNNEGSVNLSRWFISDQNNLRKFMLPEGTYLNPKEYLVVAEDLEKYMAVFPDTKLVTGSYGMGEQAFGLNNNGDCIRLYKYDSVPIDEVCYETSYPWPANADGQGPSLQLKHPTLDNANGLNWDISSIPMYTPGSVNIFNSVPAGLFSSEQNDVVIFPNPCDKYLYINVSANQDRPYSIYAFDGKIVQQGIINKRMKLVDTSVLKNGIYLLHIKNQQTGIDKTCKLTVQH